MSQSLFEVQLVNSTAIRLVAFSENTLRVIFRSGSAYDYSGVSREVFEQLASAESVGTQFQSIRNAYQFTRIESSRVQNFLMAVLEASLGDRLIVADN
ncbi:KTSC domain-containing protein [Nostoc sp.]|uniref:KTSC domain-containing protein n=1 Tax=Nostoc sp. TaxID=1180 RepID=UPI002FF90931